MLSRRWLVNGLLFVAIAGLALLGYRLDRPPASEPPAATAAFDAGAIERIEIRTADARLSLHRLERGWTLLEPARWPADRASVERLFRIVATGDTAPLEGTGIDLARLGLDPPLADVRLGETRVRFGTVNILGERRYTMIDSALYLLPDVHLPLILQGASGYIDRRLLPPEFGLAALSLPGLELQRETGGAWRASGNGAIAAESLAGLIDSWQRLEATRIGAYEDPRAPTGRIVAQTTEGERIEFLLLATDPELVIANPGLGMQYHFRGEYYDRLFTPATHENSA